MRSSISDSKIHFKLIIIAMLISVMAYLATTLNGSEILSLGITIDLVVTVPFFYFLLIRKSNIPKITLIPVFIFGIIIGTIFIPKEHQNWLDLIKTWVLPLVEITVLLITFLKFRKLRTVMKTAGHEGVDFYSSLKAASAEILPKKLAIFFATELAVFYYAIFKWQPPRLKQNEFTYHQKTGTNALLYGLLVVIVIETFVFHILLRNWSSSAAWILTALSIYSAFQVLGFTKSLSMRPIALIHGNLKLNYGIMAETAISLNDIERLQHLSWKDEIDTSVLSLSPLDSLDSFNLIIHFKNEQTLYGFYGKKKVFKSLAIHIDQKEEFIEQLAILKQT